MVCYREQGRDLERGSCPAGCRGTRRVKMEGWRVGGGKVRTTPNVATRGIKSQSELGYIFDILRTAVSADLGGSTGSHLPSGEQWVVPVGTASNHSNYAFLHSFVIGVRFVLDVCVQQILSSNASAGIALHQRNGTIDQRFSHDDIGTDAEGGMAALADRIPVTQSTHADVPGKVLDNTSLYSCAWGLPPKACPINSGIDSQSHKPQSTRSALIMHSTDHIFPQSRVHDFGITGQATPVEAATVIMKNAVCARVPVFHWYDCQQGK